MPLSDKDRTILEDLILVANIRKVYSLSGEEDEITEKLRDDLFIELYENHKEQFKVEPIIKVEVEKITDEQYDDLLWELSDNKILLQSLLNNYNIFQLKELPKSEYRKAILEIRKRKRLADEYNPNKNK